ncbi:MAG: hypothetical protein JSW46_02005 [Gemmatimonadota bacterium]|nr:MAG: hypothetical protein JSW46_02005 [Gemmatimonadota bacterium]
MRPDRVLATLCVTFASNGAFFASLQAQAIPREEYLKYIPLEYPAMVRQTRATEAFNLYGDTSDPSYRDVAPIDGIDDRRHEVLLDLSVRFAPYMVMNTTAIPMSWRRYMDQGSSFALFVDTWDVSSKPELIGTGEIDLVSLLDRPCDPSSAQPLGEVPDCRLLALLDEFEPLTPGAAHQRGAVAAELEEFKVMFFDFPGEDPKSWRAEYEDMLSGLQPRATEDFAEIHSHPFIVEVRSNETGELVGYEFVLQYWFFYPFNDGGNNHEGDWEHINVLIAPLGRVERPLSADDVRWILDGGGMSDDPRDRLVIRKIDYYFHRHVITLDYTRPNVYQPRDRWELEVRNTPRERLGEDWYWKQIRYYAYWDREETVINTHPIAFIGADNKGTDQLLHSPGGSNRDSHGTFPYPALYKDIGPAGAAEQVPIHFDHREYYSKGGDDQVFRGPRFKRGHAESFVDPDKIEIVPDGERVVDLVKENPQARRDWAWLVLPLRWGYPATESPFAGVVAHAETGNISVVGPSYNGGWNRIGDARGYSSYMPHKFSWMLPTTWQDGFANNLGWLNLTGPTLIVLPPLDLLWRVVLAPFRSLLGTQNPILHPHEGIPYRFVGVMPIGLSVMVLNDGDWVNLFINEDQTDEIVRRVMDAVEAADSVVGGVSSSIEGVVGYAEISLYLGRRFASENTIRHGRLDMGLDIFLPSVAEDFQLRGELNFWEYSGSIRFNLSTGGLLPFVKGGYGLAWYRVEDVATNGVPLINPNGPWVTQFAWHIGVGLEWVPIRSFAPIPKGIDLGVRGEALLYSHKLGIDRVSDVPLFFVSEQGMALEGGPTVHRPVFNFAITVSF